MEREVERGRKGEMCGRVHAGAFRNQGAVQVAAVAPAAKQKVISHDLCFSKIARCDLHMHSLILLHGCVSNSFLIFISRYIFSCVCVRACVRELCSSMSVYVR